MKILDFLDFLDLEFLVFSYKLTRDIKQISVFKKSTKRFFKNYLLVKAGNSSSKRTGFLQGEKANLALIYKLATRWHKTTHVFFLAMQAAFKRHSGWKKQNKTEQPLQSQGCAKSQILMHRNVNDK